jgi:hypothetical protein
MIHAKGGLGFPCGRLLVVVMTASVSNGNSRGEDFSGLKSDESYPNFADDSACFMTNTYRIVRILRPSSRHRQFAHSVWKTVFR